MLPDLPKTGETRGDHYRPLDETNTYDFAVEDPVNWETFFNWTSYFDDADTGVKLDVSSTRESPDPMPVANGDAECRDGLYPFRASCRMFTTPDGRVVVVSDGIRSEEGGTWHRQVEVLGPEGVRGMDSRVFVSVFGTARTRAAADEQLPSLADLRRLALDPDLVLPEPASFPEEFPE